MNRQEQISKNFKLGEFAVSTKASALGYKFDIPEELIPNVKLLVEKLLQPICDAMGWKDKVNSGYRDPYVNKLVGGVPTSQHMTAEAADNMFFIKVDGKPKYIAPIDVLKAVKELDLDFDQMIAYPGFVHLSYTGKRKNRKQILYNSSYKGARL